MDRKDHIDKVVSINHKDGAPNTSLKCEQQIEMLKGKYIMIKRKMMLHDQN